MMDRRSELIHREAALDATPPTRLGATLGDLSISIRAGYSARSYTRSFEPDPFDFLERAGVPREHHRTLAAMVVSIGIEQSIYRLAYAHIAGIPYQQIAEYFSPRSLTFDNMIMYSHSVSGLRAAKLERRCEAAFGSHTVTLFPAAFHLLPSEVSEGNGFNSKSASLTLDLRISHSEIVQLLEQLPAEIGAQVANQLQLSIPGTVAKLGVFASKSLEPMSDSIKNEMLTSVGGLLTSEIQENAEEAAERGEIASTSLAEESLNRLLSILADDSILIYEIASPLFEALEAHAPQAQYRDWRILSVLALESMAGLPTSKDPWKVNLTDPRVVDPESDAWRHDRALFNALGYLPDRTRYGEASLTRQPLGNIREASSRSMLHEFWSAFSVERVSVELTTMNLFEHYFEEYHWMVAPGEPYLTAHPLRRPFIFGGLDHSASLGRDFEHTPQIPIAIDTVPGITGAMIARWRELTAPAAEIVAALQPEFTLISRGAELGVTGAWWNSPDPIPSGSVVAGMHIAGQNRHPSVRMAAFDESGRPKAEWCLGIKGGGLRELDINDVNTYENTDPAVRYPFYSRVYIKKKEDEIESHRLWGGLTYQDAEAEFVNTLGAQTLVKQLGLESEIELPIPLDFGVITTFPSWRGGKTEWVDRLEYYYEILGDPGSLGGRLSTYRTLTRSDVRISQLFNHLFSPDTRHETDLRSSFTAALNHLYRTHGFNLNDPGHELPIGRRGIGPGEVLHFLHGFARANAEAAEIIADRIASQSLRFTALVHGTGGHLGGSRLLSLAGGASGGATTIRNVDLRGSIHDLDRDVYFPWIERHDFSREVRADQGRKLKVMQHLDLLHWKHTNYWARRILHGIAEDRRASLYEHTVGDIDTFMTLERRPREIVKFKQLVESIPERWQSRWDPTTFNLRGVSLQRHTDEYLRYYAHGRGVRMQHTDTGPAVDFAR